MNVLILCIYLFLIIIIINAFQTLLKKEKFNFQDTNLASLSRQELQSPPNIDLSKIDWTKIDDYTYSKILCLIQQCDERPIINNLPIFNQ